MAKTKVNFFWKGDPFRVRYMSTVPRTGDTVVLRPTGEPDPVHFRVAIVQWEADDDCFLYEEDNSLQVADVFLEIER